MTTTVSSQRYLDDVLVASKGEAGDYVVTVTPEFEYAGGTYAIVLDGHHSLQAAKVAGVAPTFVVANRRSSDVVAAIDAGDIETALDMAHMGDDWYDISTGKLVW